MVPGIRHSCLYDCEVMHHRVSPANHQFKYRVFMFCLDLDELEQAHKQLKLFSYNRPNWFSFRDGDHFHSKDPQSIKLKLKDFLKTKGIEWNGRTMLITNARTLGYVFNPISFFFCFDENENPLCAVAEVCNTHKEMKLYLLDGSSLADGSFKLRTPKHFYVSPFSELDTEFEFIFKIPSHSMEMRVDDYKQGKRILLSALTGTRRPLTDLNLLWYGLRFPLITVKIIVLIYWQALKLRLKGLPFWRKDANLHLQKDFVNTNPIS